MIKSTELLPDLATAFTDDMVAYTDLTARARRLLPTSQALATTVDPSCRDVFLWASGIPLGTNGDGESMTLDLELRYDSGKMWDGADIVIRGKPSRFLQSMLPPAERFADGLVQSMKGTVRQPRVPNEENVLEFKTYAPWLYRSSRVAGGIALSSRDRVPHLAILSTSDGGVKAFHGDYVLALVSHAIGMGELSAGGALTSGKAKI